VSDHFIRIIPNHPQHVPTEADGDRLLRTARELFPRANEFEVQHPGGVTFIDAGGNFELVRCDQCREVLDRDWWIGQMDLAYKTRFVDLTTTCPHCGETTSLNELDYDWPQGFATWWIDVMNAGVGRPGPHHAEQLSQALGHQVRLVYKHL
jgi:predicted RNA-binding Zn-ribbon protein involved in translation (DUF1610 family)